MTRFDTYQLCMTAEENQDWRRLIRCLFPLTERVEFQPRTAYYDTGEQLQWTPTQELQKDLLEQVIVPSLSSNMRWFFYSLQPTSQVLDLLVHQVSPHTSDQWGCPPIPKLYRQGEVLMEWDHNCFWLKLTEREAQALHATGIPVSGPYTQRRQYHLELQDLEADWLKLLDFCIPKADHVTFQADPVTISAQDQTGTWQEKIWQWSPSAELQVEGSCSKDRKTWTFPLTSTIEAFLRSNDCLGEWHLGNKLPEDPCLLAGNEQILITVSHEELIWVRLLESEFQALQASELGMLFPYPDCETSTGMNC